MRRHLVEFLFGPGATSRDLEDPSLGDRIVRMFEEADNAERELMAVNKKPLESVLRKLGVRATVTAFPQWAEIHFECPAAYREAYGILFAPDALHDLAEAGWIPAHCGDAAMSNEVADLKIGFFELDVAATGSDDTGPDLDKVAQDSAADSATAMERDSGLNPVENPDEDAGGAREGVGRATAGKAPEGKPKGSSKQEAQNAQELADRLLEMTSVSAVPPVMEPPLTLMRPPQNRPGRKRAKVPKAP